LGQHLANFKCFNFSKCEFHVDTLDSFLIIDCSRCRNANKPQIKHFLDTVKEITGYCKSYINLMIDLSKLAKEYKKIQYTSVTISEVKTHMNFLKDRMILDYAFWQ